eukprot:3052358-Pleurochrysis_carterae.AAC.1
MLFNLFHLAVAHNVWRDGGSDGAGNETTTCLMGRRRPFRLTLPAALLVVVLLVLSLIAIASTCLSLTHPTGRVNFLSMSWTQQAPTALTEKAATVAMEDGAFVHTSMTSVGKITSQNSASPSGQPQQAGQNKKIGGEISQAATTPALGQFSQFTSPSPDIHSMILSRKVEQSTPGKGNLLQDSGAPSVKPAASSQTSMKPRIRRGISMPASDTSAAATTKEASLPRLLSHTHGVSHQLVSPADGVKAMLKPNDKAPDASADLQHVGVGSCARIRSNALLYAAHSGFGNQELSLRKALLLSYVLNRTL